MSTSGSGGPPLDKPVTADEVEYLITELEECRKKAKILEENSYFFHHWKIFEFLFLKDTIAAKAVFDAWNTHDSFDLLVLLMVMFPILRLTLV